jgi:hypothetical protein
MWAQVELARQGCTFGLTCQDAGVSRIRRAWLRGNDLEVRAGQKPYHTPRCSIVLAAAQGKCPVPVLKITSASLRQEARQQGCLPRLALN